MSVKEFCWLLNEAKFGKNDKAWFPRWVRRYASMADEVPETLSGAEGEWVGGQETAHNMGAHSTTWVPTAQANFRSPKRK